MDTTTNEKQPKNTITGSYSYGWQQLWRNFLYFFLVVLVIAIAEAPTSVLQKSENWERPFTSGLYLLGIAYGLLVLPVLKYGADYLYLKGIRNETLDLNLLVRGFSTNYVQIILASLLTFVIVGLGIIFLIIPGIIFACRLVFVPYIVMDKRLEPVAAIEKSWEMTRGYGWKVFGMAMLAIPVFIAGLLCFIVGAIISAMWISASFAALYHAIDWEQQEKLELNGVN